MTPALLVVALLGFSLSADPNEPHSTIVWRGDLRATIAVTLPIVGEPEAEGFQLRLPGFIELYNHGALALVPFEYWRGHFALEAAWRSERTLLGRLAQVELVAALEHESDHPTSLSWNPYGWVNLNDLALRGRATTKAGALELQVGGTFRLHLLTCTVNAEVCGSYGGLGGSRTVEVAGDAGVRGPLPFATKTAWFASAAGSWTLPNALAIEERWVVLNVGLVVPRAGGNLLPFLVALVGSDLGYHRWNDVAQFGLGFRWLPAP